MKVECIVIVTNHKFSILSYYVIHGTIMFYDKITDYMHIKYIQRMELEILQQPLTLTQEKHVIYKPPTIHIESFLQLLECIYVKALYHCPTTFICDFNVDMLENISSLKQLKDHIYIDLFGNHNNL